MPEKFEKERFVFNSRQLKTGLGGGAHEIGQNMRASQC